MTTQEFRTIGDFKLLVEQARSLIKGTKTTFFLLTLTAAVAIALLAVSVVGIILIPVVAAGLTLTAGLLGLRRTQGQDVSFNSVQEVKPYLLQATLFAVGITVISFLLSFIPVIGQILTLAVAPFTAFGMLFIIDKNNTAIEAVQNTIELVKANLNAFGLLIVTYFVTSIIGAFTLGIGMLWVIPFLFILEALIYLEATSAARELEADFAELHTEAPAETPAPDFENPVADET